MSRHSDEVMMLSNQDGVGKVTSSNGDYAFFMESTSIEYILERDCALQKIGENLDSKSYGIALPKGKKRITSYENVETLKRVCLI